MRFLLLPLFTLLLMALPAQSAEETLRFAELEFIEALLNPPVRETLEGKTVEIVGELTIFDNPNEETGLIKRVGFGKTYGTTIYQIWCNLKEPITREAFDRLSMAEFIVLKGDCKIATRTREAGADLWYDFSISLSEGEITYQAPEKAP